MSLPGEPTSMANFGCLIKVVRILSTTLEILYTTTNRRGTLTKIATIDRLLDGWVDTLPEHLQIDFTTLARQSPEVTMAGLGDMKPAIVFLHSAYLYTRFIAHRPALSFPTSHPQYRKSLLRCMETAKLLVLLASHSRQNLLVLDVNPGTHVYTVWSCGLMSMFGIWELKSTEDAIGHDLIPAVLSTQELQRLCAWKYWSF